MRLWLNTLAVATLSLSGVARADDSVVPIADGTTILRPIARIEAKKIDESSGIVFHKGAYFTHNDSGGDPVIYRSETLDFKDPERLEVPGAEAVDWEDIATVGDDLLIGDIGDNARKRKHITLYRVHYHEATAAAPAKLTRVATYRVKYSDEAHDAEGLFSRNGQIHIVSKARGEPSNALFALTDPKDVSALGADEFNVADLVGGYELPEGEQVTAADYDPKTNRLVLLTYTQLLTFPKGKLVGAPERATVIGARQCEAVCVNEGRLVFTNEQRDVFAIDRFFDRAEVTQLVPSSPRILLLPTPDEAEAASSKGRVPGHGTEKGFTTVRLKHTGTDELVLVRREGDHLRFFMKLNAGELKPLVEGQPLGGGVLICLARDATLAPTDRTLTALAAVGPGGDARLVALDLATSPAGQSVIEDATIVGGLRRGVVAFDLKIPWKPIFGETMPATFQLNLWGLKLRGDDTEPYLAGPDVFSISRPYLWSKVTVAPQPDAVPEATPEATPKSSSDSK